MLLLLSLKTNHFKNSSHPVFSSKFILNYKLDFGKESFDMKEKLRYDFQFKAINKI
jgi:hypothetical protein